jgi:hypothetical protein
MFVEDYKRFGKTYVSNFLVSISPRGTPDNKEIRYFLEVELSGHWFWGCKLASEVTEA